jgi:two-component system, NtrC family, nitrogen regulation sensor histidine kinase GlnL
MPQYWYFAHDSCYDYIMISEQLHTRLLENLSTAILLLDNQLHLSHINAAAEILLGLSGNRHIGQPIKKLLMAADSTVITLQETLASGRPHTQREAILTTSSGSKIVKTTVDYTITPIEDIPGSALIVEIQPIDRLLRISREETLFSAQESTHALLKGMAHEIKNPLGGLRGAAQLLERELIDDNLKEYTQVIISEADRLRNLVDRMLGPAKPQSLSTINIHEVLERVRQLTEADAGDRISIIRDYDPSIPDFLADPERLIQAALNITCNAVQALQTKPDDGAKPKITISSRVIRQFTIGGHNHKLVCRIDIRDNGPGIPNDIQDKVFIPMVSGHASNSGLGLSIAQSIVNQHHGLIAFSSDVGDTCFSIFLPLHVSG